MARPAPGHFTSDAHAFLSGGLFGLLLKESKTEDGILQKVTPVLDEHGNYKPYVDVEAFGKTYRVIVAEVEV